MDEKLDRLLSESLRLFKKNGIPHVTMDTNPKGKGDVKKKK